jgi:hypothetical protein
MLRTKMGIQAGGQWFDGGDVEPLLEARAKKYAEKKDAEERISAPTLYLELDTIFVWNCKEQSPL